MLLLRVELLKGFSVQSASTEGFQQLGGSPVQQKLPMGEPPGPATACGEMQDGRLPAC